MSTPTRTIALAAALLSLAACTNDAGEPTVTAAPETTPAAVQTAASKEVPASIVAGPPAGDIVKTMRTQLGKNIAAVKVWTEASDPNSLLGRPGQYVTSATLVDKRTNCTDPEPGVDCGATVEVFASEADARARASYISDMLKGAPMLGTEYHTVAEMVLLRVTGRLTPTVNRAYVAAFRQAI